jgi:uncharacterized membrane protein YedE/YeeE
MIGLFVPLLLLIGNKQLGMTTSLRTICAAVAPRRVEFFRFDWKRTGLWSVALAAGIFTGAALAVALLGGGGPPAISQHTRDAIAALGLSSPSGLVPTEILSWRALLTTRGAVCVLGGGFLVGFGSSYAGGCTSGHGVMGLAAMQVASVIALVGIYIGGLLATFLLLPAIV